LRIKSVRDFTFGFARREDHGAEPPATVTRYSGNKKYMVHLFTSVRKYNIEGLFSELKSAVSPDVFYFGKTVANIERRSSSGGINRSPFPVDGLIIWEADDLSQLKSMLTSDDYQDFLGSNDTNGVYVVRRVL
jgi:hypothetical protein